MGFKLVVGNNGDVLGLFELGLLKVFDLVVEFCG